MKRNIITIDEEKCVGCGLCANACHQGAIQIIDGKAKLVSESYCDGLGMCLPKCPTNAIKLEEKETQEFDKSRKNIKNGGGCPSTKPETIKKPDTLACGCPSTESVSFDRSANQPVQTQPVQNVNVDRQSELMQWPCQIKLVPPNAPYLENAKLIVCADCTAYANANIHKFMKGKITLIGCPKLDEGDYADKLTEILKYNDIQSVDVIRMSVPCCNGIVNAVKQALINSGKMIPWSVKVVSTDGTILD